MNMVERGTGLSLSVLIAVSIITADDIQAERTLIAVNVIHSGIANT